MKMKNVNNTVRRGEYVLYIIIFLACVTLIVILSTVIHSYFCCCKSTIAATSVNSLILSCVTLSITMSVVVPWMISKTHIYSVAEDAVKKYYDKDFSESIKKTHGKIFKAYANDSRMIAYMLCQQNKPIWALGWICKSSCTYMKVFDSIQSHTYAVLSTSNIFVLIECVLQINNKLNKGVDFKYVLNADNDEKIDNVAVRTTRDLIKFCSDIRLKDRDYKDVFRDTTGQDIPETLKESLELLLMCIVTYLNLNNREIDLEQVLELDNPDESNSASHITKLDALIKESRKSDLNVLLNNFSESANILKDQYDEYKRGRRSMMKLI